MPRGRLPLSRFATHDRYSRSFSWLWFHRGDATIEDLAALMWLSPNSLKKVCNAYGITLGSSGCTDQELAQLKVDDGVDAWHLEPALLIDRVGEVKLPPHVRTRLEELLAADVNGHKPTTAEERAVAGAPAAPAPRDESLAGPKPTRIEEEP